MSTSRTVRKTRHLAGLLLIAGFIAALLLLAAPRAHATVYWSNFGNASRTTIGSVDNDGNNVNTNFVTGADAPCGVAVDGSHVYWANYGQFNGLSRIGRVDIDGNNPDQSFIPLTTTAVCGVAVDSSNVYWTATGHGSGGAVGMSALASPNPPNEAFIGGTTGPCGVAVNSNNIFWANNGNGTIGRSDRFGGNVTQTFASGGSAPCGIDANDSYVYWANFNAGNVMRAPADGSGVPQVLIGGLEHPCGVAIDGTNIFWADFSRNSIGKADLDGNNVNQDFMDFAENPCGVAVTHTLPGPPTPATPSNPVNPGASRGVASNDFLIKKVKRNKRKGTAKLIISLPASGTLTVTGKDVAGVAQNVGAAGVVRVPIKVEGDAKTKLESDGKVRVTVVVTFAAFGGDTKSITKRITLKLKL